MLKTQLSRFIFVMAFPWIVFALASLVYITATSGIVEGLSFIGVLLLIFVGVGVFFWVMHKVAKWVLEGDSHGY